MAANVRTNVLDEKAKATRRKILRETTKLFARQGYHRTTVTDIANAIGMTQGALFHHFPNKDALLLAVVKRLSRGFEDYRVAMEEEGEGSVVDRVLNIMVEHYEAQPEATICLAALATEFAGSDHPVLDEIRNAYEAFVAPFEKVLSTHPTVKNPRGASIAFIGSVQGIAIQGLLREGGEYALRDLAKSFLNLIHMPEEAINGNG